MKIYISHAALDKDFATKFVDLLQLGVGVFHDDLFYSSVKGTIPNGEFFVQHIIAALNSSDLVIALLSKSYFSSHFCLAEAGAALARKAAGMCDFLSLVLPPATFSDLDGMLHGVQSGSIIERPALAEVKDRIQAHMKFKVPGSNIWDQKREEFLIAAQQAVSLYEAKEALQKLIVNNWQWRHEPGSPEHPVHVNYKIRVNLENRSSIPIHIESGTWNSGIEGIPPFQPTQQLKWRIKEGDAEAFSISVPAGRVFRTWIGLAASVDMAECLRRAAARQTGTMRLRLKIGGQFIDHDLGF